MNRTGRLRVLGRTMATEPQRSVFRKRRPPRRPRLILEGMLLVTGGVGLLLLLLQLPRLVDLDSLLLVSTAIGHLIGGLSQLLLGCLQLLGVLVLVALALLALALLVGGLLRLIRAVLGVPRPPAKAPKQPPSRRPV
jgi:Na+-transporting methylmalonyl-CoA/oxaloacetate decarboxylase gamma subunit